MKMPRHCSLLCLLAITLFLGGCLTNHLEPDQPSGWRTLAELPASAPFFLVKINGSLYAGTGNGKVPDRLSNLWQYDFASTSWKPKKDFPGKLTRNLSYFTVNEKLYVGLSTTGESDPTASFELEAYSTDFYEYDPATDDWKTVDAPPSSGILSGPRRGTGTTSFTYQNKGIALWGLFRTPASLATTSNGDGVAYDGSKSWHKVNVTIYGTPTFPKVPDQSLQSQLATYRVVRGNGFGFCIDNRVYTGGGHIYQFGSFSPLYGYDEIRKEANAHHLYEFEGAESPDGLNLVLINKFQTPSMEYDLTSASQAFSLKNTGYIITYDGSLISFTPGTNEWHVFEALSSPLVVGTSLNEKAYFIDTANQLLEYTPK